MATRIDTLLDKNGNTILPRTRTKAVYDDDNNRLDNTLTELQETITGLAGKKIAGQTVSPTADTTKTASTGAEIFNDYRNRTFNDDGAASAGNVASGQYSHAEGRRTTASGDWSHAEGSSTTASGMCSHAEGSETTASGSSSHAEGYNNTVSGDYSHAEGASNTVSGNFSHAEGHINTASGNCSHTEGSETTASGHASHAEGKGTKAEGDRSHAEGEETTASASCAHAEGYKTTASNVSAHAEGSGTTASGYYSHAEGFQTTASGSYAHAEGYCTTASGQSSHAGGQQTIANKFQTAHGRYNKSSDGATSITDTSGDIFIIGNGTAEESRSNAFRVTTAGQAYGLANFSGSGAGVAELYEWQDGNPDNEDRRGLFVTLDGEKIKIASPDDDYILGTIDPCPYVVGDVQSEIWKDMYLKDVFGEKMIETVEVEETTDENGQVIPAHTEERWILNPEYDPTQKYISRDERSEFVAITSKGKVVMIDDGTCQVNGYCTVGENGVATASETNFAVRVMERIDDTHIKVYIDSIFINK